MWERLIYHFDFYRKLFADGLDECRFSGAHLSVEGKDSAASCLHIADKFSRRLTDGAQVCYMKRFHLGCIVMKGIIISSIEMPPCWNVFR